VVFAERVAPKNLIAKRMWRERMGEVVMSPLLLFSFVLPSADGVPKTGMI
jgi:hypothetical protein